MVLLQAVGHQNTFVILIECKRQFMIPSLLVFMNDDHPVFAELAGAVDPHITFTAGMPVIMDHLCRCFIGLCHREF